MVDDLTCRLLHGPTTDELQSWPTPPCSYSRNSISSPDVAATVDAAAAPLGANASKVPHSQEENTDCSTVSRWIIYIAAIASFQFGTRNFLAGRQTAARSPSRRVAPSRALLSSGAAPRMIRRNEGSWSACFVRATQAARRRRRRSSSDVFSSSGGV